MGHRIQTYYNSWAIAAKHNTLPGSSNLNVLLLLGHLTYMYNSSWAFTAKPKRCYSISRHVVCCESAGLCCDNTRTVSYCHSFRMERLNRMQATKCWTCSWLMAHAMVIQVLLHIFMRSCILADVEQFRPERPAGNNSAECDKRHNALARALEVESATKDSAPRFSVRAFKPNEDDKDSMKKTLKKLQMAVKDIATRVSATKHRCPYPNGLSVVNAKAGAPESLLFITAATKMTVVVETATEGKQASSMAYAHFLIAVNKPKDMMVPLNNGSENDSYCPKLQIRMEGICGTLNMISDLVFRICRQGSQTMPKAAYIEQLAFYDVEVLQSLFRINILKEGEVLHACWTASLLLSFSLLKAKKCARAGLQRRASTQTVLRVEGLDVCATLSDRCANKKSQQCIEWFMRGSELCGLRASLLNTGYTYFSSVLLVALEELVYETRRSCAVFLQHIPLNMCERQCHVAADLVLTQKAALLNIGDCLCEMYRGIEPQGELNNSCLSPREHYLLTVMVAKNLDASCPGNSDASPLNGWWNYHLNYVPGGGVYGTCINTILSYSLGRGWRTTDQGRPGVHISNLCRHNMAMANKSLTKNLVLIDAKGSAQITTVRVGMGLGEVWELRACHEARVSIELPKSTSHFTATASEGGPRTSRLLATVESGMTEVESAWCGHRGYLWSSSRSRCCNWRERERDPPFSKQLGEENSLWTLGELADQCNWQAYQLWPGSFDASLYSLRFYFEAVQGQQCSLFSYRPQLRLKKVLPYLARGSASVTSLGTEVLRS
ncbi:hypothetical protein PR048_033035 [Dryococelus australis]|uniref:Uncharacterized protein n=1 Tax=Dryococelus australis TaxID=614101 RepID=A0ABQ9G3W2_9NEOP|nr:hypothetical protein PR048_033035 [Dryococelus australis]